jgi:hypothetical protein
MKNGKGKLILPLVLAGAILLSTVGFLGLLSTLAPEDDYKGDEATGSELPNSREFVEAEVQAETQFEGSLRQAEVAKARAPEQRGMPTAGSMRISEQDVPEEGQEIGRTRSEDDLLSDEGYIGMEQMPGAPAIEIDDTFTLLNGQGNVLDTADTFIKEEEAPETFPLPDMEGEVILPVGEGGVSVDTEKVSDIDGDLSSVSREIETYLGENTPDATKAGLDEADLQGIDWLVSNRTTRDSDGDGNPEHIHDLRVVFGQRNDTALNGTLRWVVGFRYVYEDLDSDGVPNMEEATLIRFANYSINGIKIAEGIVFTSILRNDTDGDGIIDHVEIRHLSFGSRITLLKGVKSFATAGELVMKDSNNDGIFEIKEATAVFYYRHELGKPLVPVRESVLIANGKERPNVKELSKLAFTRINNTSGKTLLETGYAWTIRDQGSNRNILAIAANNNSVTGRLQYVIFNGTETRNTTATSYHVTAFAVDNRTLLFKGKRSDFVALDYTVTLENGKRTDKGVLAAARIDAYPRTEIQTYMWISLERVNASGTVLLENVTIVAGRNTTTGSSLNSTMGLVVRVFKDDDGDGDPEYLKEAAAITISTDRNSDGFKEWEAFAARSTELHDNDSDGNVDLNMTFTVLGWKGDPDSDGNIDTERTLMHHIKKTDANSNGFFELQEEALVGTLKEDSDSDGDLDNEKSVGRWKKVTDTYDDGTEINEQSGTWTNP